MELITIKSTGCRVVHWTVSVRASILGFEFKLSVYQHLVLVCMSMIISHASSSRTAHAQNIHIIALFLSCPLSLCHRSRKPICLSLLFAPPHAPKLISVPICVCATRDSLLFCCSKYFLSGFEAFLTPKFSVKMTANSFK